MDDKHGAKRRPARLRSEFVHHDAAGCRLQPMMARFGHELRGTADGAALAVGQRRDAGRAAEQFESRAPGDAWRNMFGRTKYAPDDLQPD